MSERDELAISTRIVVAVAEAEEVDPLSLSPPLAEEIDVDALERLSDASTPLQVTFSAWGYRITVRDGEVSVADDAALVTAPAN
ncbi:HalOD1 output domain-containing protein [Halomarina salina]|uniref:HalOD1 output domain-containing protein n=1 Tax=Halomarina salina TaxID=1872699 RepID=A0ABD5RKL6_9EURY|nr:HalOD1 output domain-containing protein [Halomarina salina]